MEWSVMQEVAEERIRTLLTLKKEGKIKARSLFPKTLEVNEAVRKVAIQKQGMRYKGKLSEQ